ncbi:uncharacterized protein LOC141609803 [Silene latifolia]|uniref:uncharacterized protein LOC141609803 n=1 Tax=Silene latifolia TaxID=37657 RepID=UPI003D77A199
MDNQVFIGDNRPEDVSWLHSLSESEIDLLISLKDIVVQRAKVVGHESLADKFDLKMLRALGFILIQHVKGQISDLQLTGVDKLKEMLEGCNLLKLDPGDSYQNSTNENLTMLVDMVRKRQIGTKSSETTPDPKRKRKDK